MFTSIFNYLGEISVRRIGQALAIFASLLSLLLYHFKPDSLEYLDVRAQDMAYALREVSYPPDNVIVVAVDEKSIKEYGRWPWSRIVQAKLLKRLKALEVGLIALDINYLLPESKLADQALREALQTPGTGIVGGYYFVTEQNVAPSAKTLEQLVDNALYNLWEPKGSKPQVIPQFPYVEANQADLSPYFQGLGFFNALPDPDGLLRTMPLVLAHGGDFYPSLALEALSLYKEEEIHLAFDRYGLAELKLGALSLPVDQQGKLILNFYDSEDEPRIPVISALDVLANPSQDLAHLKNALVFIGVTETVLADVRPTPTHPNFPGVKAHATVAGNVLQRNFILPRPGVFLETALIGLFPLLLIWSMTWIRRLGWMLVTFLGQLILLGFFYYWAVAQLNIIVSVVYWMLAVVLGFVFFQIYYGLVVYRRANFLRHAFSSYVSPALVGKIIDNPAALSLKGEKRQVSLLFSDIRGFTSLSESLPPETLVTILNRYLDPMTEIVLTQQGTLDKYIGDAIMVIYNAPLDLPDHAERAALSALYMQRHLATLNQEFELEFNCRLQIGIGLNSGEAIVGNMGSARRFDYTAIGDTVNLAARLEGQTKVYQVPIIISEGTRKQLTGDYLCRCLDRLQVKGKNQSVVIYELLDHDGMPRAQELVTRFEAALTLYFDREFVAALAGFEVLLEDFPEDGPTQLFCTRCQEFMAHPPQTTWGGIFVAEDK